jgi:alkane 1-monooxygenase
MRKLLNSLEYSITPALIAVNIYGVAKGGGWVWLGVYLLLAAIAADTLFPGRVSGPVKDEQGRPQVIPWLLDGLIWAMLPVFVLQQLVLAWRAHQFVAGLAPGTLNIGGLELAATTTGWQLTGALISTGIWQGMGIIFGHELSHTKGWTFTLSRWIMALSGSAHFSIAHVYNHHVDLGDPSDPATAPRGRNLYTHFILSHAGQSAFVAKAELRRLLDQGRDFFSFRNRWIQGYLMSLPSIALFAWAGGWTGLAVLLGVWIISNFELEVLNYIEHYGLIRVADQPVEERHSWDADTFLTSRAFIEIGRQGDHHVRGETRFWDLEPSAAPNYGLGYFTLLVIALIPPLWTRFVRPKLADWDRKSATPGERSIAAQINQRIGWAPAAPQPALTSLS